MSAVVVTLIACLALAPILAVAAVVIAFVVPNPLKAIDAWLYPRLDALPAPRELVLGDRVAAWVFEPPGARDSVLVCHGRSRSKRWMLPLVRVLLPDYRVLVFDFPGHGSSPGMVCTLGLREADTVDLALDWLERTPGRIHVYGVSMGGVAAIYALARRPRQRVASLVTDGSFDTLERVFLHVRRFVPVPDLLLRVAFALIRRYAGFDPLAVRPVELAHRVQARWLVLHGDRDPLVPPEAAPALATACPGATAVQYAGRHDQPTNPEMQRLALGFFAGAA